MSYDWIRWAFARICRIPPLQKHNQAGELLNMSSSDLGAVKREFKPAVSELIAGFLLGILAICAGCGLIIFPGKGVIDSHASMPFWAETGWCWFAVILSAAMGVGAIIGGILAICWIRSMFTMIVRIHMNGLSIVSRDSEQRIPWSEIESIQETHLYERPPVFKGVVKYMLPRVMSTYFTIKPHDGRDFRFDATNVREHLELASMIKRLTKPSEIPWQTVEEYR